MRCLLIKPNLTSKLLTTKLLHFSHLKVKDNKMLNDGFL